MGVLMRTLKDVSLADYDFLDFGAGDGASLLRCEEMFGGRGLGIDNNPRKVEAAEERGVDVVLGDITTLPSKKIFRYVCMDNFLEHLPDLDTVRTMLSVASSVATDFLYIAHPSFEDEAYLRQLGLKQYWHDWTGHPAHILVSDFADLLAEVGAMPIDLAYIREAWDSDDPSILPLDAPKDQHRYDLDLHGPKPAIRFERPIYWQIHITAYLGQYAGGHQVGELQREIAMLRSRRSFQLATVWWRFRRAGSWSQRRASIADAVSVLRSNRD